MAADLSPLQASGILVSEQGIGCILFNMAPIYLRQCPSSQVLQEEPWTDLE